MSTTLAQFRSAVSSKIGLDNSVAGDQGFIDLWVNEGVTDVLMRTNCKVASASLALTVGTSDYTLDVAILKILNAYTTNATQPYYLERTTLEEILAMRRTSSANVSPIQYYTVEGSNLLMVYPAPQASTDTVTFYYVPRPTVLAVSSDSPSELPSEFHKAVEYYALAQAADFADDSTSQMGMSYQQQYELWIRRMKKWVGLKGNRKLARATVVSRNTVPFHDRSVYPQ